MPNVPLILALWLHTLATVILIGHYLQLSLVYVPYFGRDPGGVAVAKSLGAVSALMRPWLLGSLLVLAGSGGYLTLADAHYLGLGNFGNPWSILMLIKHALVAAMVGLAIALDGVLRRAPGSGSLRWAKAIVGGQSALGGIVLLLTAVAQVPSA